MVVVAAMAARSTSSSEALLMYLLPIRSHLTAAMVKAESLLPVAAAAKC